MIEIYDSLSRDKKSLPNPKKKNRLFVCGPTVYDHPHIGNARTFMVFDIIVRYLRSRGVKITYLQNITDIDDKIIKRAEEEKTDWKAISRRFEKIFHDDMRRLGIVSVNRYARATDFMPQIVGQVKRLVEKGHVYFIPEDGYYFNLKTFPEYGKLAGRTVEQAEDGVSRIDESNQKRYRGDFCVWKISHGYEPGWETELGFGRPGWHIEDTAISEHFFGLQYELHGGALDLKFPHHEAEIALAESLSGRAPFVQTWMHAGFLFVDGKKMSKSLGNFITVNEFLWKNPPEAFRWMVLNHHYRSPMDYTPKLLAQSRASFSKIHQFMERLKSASKYSKGKLKTGMKDRLKAAKRSFHGAMDDDFNTPAAVAALFEISSEFQDKSWELSRKDAKALYAHIERMLKSLGIELRSPEIPENIRELAAKREAFRSSEQFVLSDALRKEADALGYIIEDTPAGPFLWPKDPT